MTEDTIFMSSNEIRDSGIDNVKYFYSISLLLLRHCHFLRDRMSCFFDWQRLSECVNEKSSFYENDIKHAMNHGMIKHGMPLLCSTPL